MVKQSRRQFVGAGIAALALGTAARAQSAGSQAATHRVVVIGGGAGGATAARHIARATKGEIDVTLIEANKTYRSCFFSNHYLGGFRDFGGLEHGYGTLASDYGITVVHDLAKAIDRDKKKIELTGGSLRYDTLILAPGIDFVDGSVNGWSLDDQDKMPHAYQGGAPVRLLRAQIEAMPAGGVFAIVPPQGTYRCPPGPYERLTIIAHLLKQINPTAKIIIADPKPLFSKMSLFRESWRKYYKGMIDMNSDVDMSTFEVDPDDMTIRLDGETIKVDACNVIPSQKAGKIAELAGLTVDGWAPVYAHDMRSKVDDNIYVLGDAAAQGDMPKSAFSANSQAFACAEAILARLQDRELPEPDYNNICWSLLAPQDSVKIGASYEATPDGIKRVEGFVSQRREGAEIRKETYEESLAWYESIVADMFG
ncbi:NAD(P)/FAD-dependent oxidoreductase [Hoeflea prorocentri]|uniref:NAD(P)/FAD-dependent oxidoreductase n=1 Tax=Hoeflea prorocentri TaxID=1922333 RepID=A0A9X3ZI73_9HYPH|nr:NAD(P)/FAD-dependent oxidoreductase [Hoeflea prorocentri]MCY6381556.1 NAD(P)/FAD-dependent oxidoreductase [Hoeflea prorocentri]MDA5399356.1 NAD(P)/FAD-dependent oxidoreductase [Hoeflea prorocentri]